MQRSLIKPHLGELVTETSIDELKSTVTDPTGWVYDRKVIVLRDLSLDLCGFYDFFSWFSRPWPADEVNFFSSERVTRVRGRYAMVYDNDEQNSLKGHLGCMQ